MNWHDSNSRVVLEHQDPNLRPGIKDIGNLDNYNIIFIGYPLWWQKAPHVVYTLIESKVFSNKKFIPFCTSTSDPIGDSGSDLSVRTPNSKWLSGNRFSERASESSVTTWIESISFNPPEEQPTSNPTQSPSRSPTRVPTQSPSRSPTRVPNRPPSRSSTRTPTLPAILPPTKPPVTSENISVSEFQPSNRKVTIDVNSDDYKNYVLYNIIFDKSIKEVQVNLNSDKKIALVLPPESREILIDSNGQTPKSFDIIIQCNEITINLGDQTKPSLQNAKGKVRLNNM